MRTLIPALLLCPLFLFSQSADPVVFENVMLTANPNRIAQFEMAVAAHNKKFHPKGPREARVYEILTGPNTGKYVWSSATTWKAMDTRVEEAGHMTDWTTNVSTNSMAEAYGNYWELNAELSFFPNDFVLSKLLVWQVDVERNQSSKLEGLMKKVRAVHAAKLPNDYYGVYNNAFSRSSDGNDLAIVWFFDKYSWVGTDNQFNKLFEEVHGAGTWQPFLDEWISATKGVDRELWMFREDLSGVDGKVVAATRQ